MSPLAQSKYDWYGVSTLTDALETVLYLQRATLALNNLAVV